jgi:phosphatidylglycerophosphate synthase
VPAVATPAGVSRGTRDARATTAVLLATAVTDDAQPAALLAWQGGTIAGHLVEQLGALGVGEIVVVTRPRWQRTVAAALDGSPVPTRVEASADRVADLHAIAAVARTGRGPLLVAHAEIVTHGQALAGLLADPRVATGILATTGRAGGPFAHRVRAQRGRVVAAASPHHRVHGPTASFLGVLKVADGDRAVMAQQNTHLAHLVADWPDAGGEDAVALTLVGLVRAPATVGVTYLRSMYWARPATAREVAVADAEIAGVDEDAALLDAAVKATDGFFTTFFVSPYSRHIARWAARRGLRPNLVTTVSLLVGVLAAVAFAAGDRAGLVAGAILLQLAFTLDCVDGQLARYTRQFSKLGAWLDSIFDRAKEYAVYAGLAIGSAHAGDPVWVLAGAALALQTVRHMLDFSYAAAQHERLGTRAPLALERADDGAAPAASAAPPPSRAGGLAGAWRGLQRRSGVVWIKRVIAFPIGERFAAISLVAALWTPRTVFVVLLSWGGLAAAYSLAGRLRSVAR